MQTWRQTGNESLGFVAIDGQQQQRWRGDCSSSTVQEEVKG